MWTQYSFDWSTVCYLAEGALESVFAQDLLQFSVNSHQKIYQQLVQSQKKERGSNQGVY